MGEFHARLSLDRSLTLELAELAAVWQVEVAVATDDVPVPDQALARATRPAAWALLMPAIVMGGIVDGVMTPTNAGAVAVVHAWVVAMFVYRELRLSDVYDALGKDG